MKSVMRDVLIPREIWRAPPERMSALTWKPSKPAVVSTRQQITDVVVARIPQHVCGTKNWIETAGRPVYSRHAMGAERIPLGSRRKSMPFSVCKTILPVVVSMVRQDNNRQGGRFQSMHYNLLGKFYMRCIGT